jgi:formylglycine-generating enzyme required for sulfatase activity
MKPFKIILILFLSAQFIAQAQFIKKSFHSAQDLKTNFVKINKNVYACKYETTNQDYVRFLNHVKYRMNPAVYNSLLPDTNKWNDEGFKKYKWVKSYLRDPKFALYPVVNITYEQANFYCAWLTKEYERSTHKPFKKIAFKLPSKQEWQQAVSNNDKNLLFPWGKIESEKPRRLKINDADRLTKGKLNNPLRVNQKGYIQSKNGMFHVVGNVSEMIAGKGDCVGGNFRSDPFYRYIDAPNEFYPGYIPCPLLGFRIFFQVLEE